MNIDPQLLIAQRERRHNIKDARHILARLALKTDTELSEPLSQWSYLRRARATHNYVLSLHEWALLEADTGMIVEALVLITLSELRIDQFEDMAMDGLISDIALEDAQHLITAIRALRNTIAAERIRLQAQLQGTFYEP